MALNPPLPPITHEQILHGELASLLEEDDYNLTTMVNLKLYTIHFDNYLSLSSIACSIKTSTSLYYISHSVIDFMLSKFSVYRIIIFFSQRQAFAAYRSASSGPCGKYSPNNFDVQNNYLYNILIL